MTAFIEQKQNMCEISLSTWVSLDTACIIITVIDTCRTYDLRRVLLPITNLKIYIHP